MSPLDERTERLIVRRLDGELSAEEEHELNKLLIRSPESRQLLESYLEQDRLAGEVLAEEVGSPAPPEPDLVTVGATPLRPPRERQSWLASSVGGVMVACLALFAVLWRPGFLPVRPAAENGMHVAGPAAMALPITAGEEFQRLPAHLELPQTQEQELTRRFIGVYDEDKDRYYILEVRRVCTSTRLVSGGI